MVRRLGMMGFLWDSFPAEFQKLILTTVTMRLDTMIPQGMALRSILSILKNHRPVGISNVLYGFGQLEMPWSAVDELLLQALSEATHKAFESIKGSF